MQCDCSWACGEQTLEITDDKSQLMWHLSKRRIYLAVHLAKAK